MNNFDELVEWLENEENGHLNQDKVGLNTLSTDQGIMIKEFLLHLTELRSNQPYYQKRNGIKIEIKWIRNSLQLMGIQI